MVNLYQILNLSYSASEGEIRSALLGKKEFLNRETIDAVNKWLLVETVRPRYDAALRRRFPEFFRPFWLVLWAVWFVWLGWRQIVFVRTTVGGYLPKGWMQPVAWVFVMFAGIVLILCIGFILGGLIPVGAA